MALSKEEFLRKLLHILSGLGIPAIIYFLPHVFNLPHIIPIIILSFFFGTSIIIEFIRFKVPRFQLFFLKQFHAFLRKEENYKITGSTWIFASALLCSIIFPSEIAAISICLFILGDAVAAITGLTIGRIKIGNKTMEGSLGCFISCLLLFYFLFPKIDGLLNMWNGTIPMSNSIIISLIVTISELFPIKIGSKFVLNDNFITPILTSAALLILTHI